MTIYSLDCTPFPIWNQSVVPCPVLTVNSWPAYRFLKRQVRWTAWPFRQSQTAYSHLFQNFQQFVVIHTVKGFGIINKAEIGVFWNSLAFSMIQWMLAIWSLVPLPFLNPVCTSGSSWFAYCWILASKDFEHYFASLWNECNCVVVWIFFRIAFLWDCNENRPFPALWPLLSFPNLLAYWV